MLISDSCHSGTVTRAAKDLKDADSQPRFMPMGNWLPTSCCQEPRRQRSPPR